MSSALDNGPARSRNPGSSAAQRPRVILVGLGAVGSAIGRALLENPRWDLVGAIDGAASVVGRDLGEVLGGDPLGLTVTANADGLGDADATLAIETTSDLLEVMASTARPFLEAGINVVSTCDELRAPRETHPVLAAELDDVARRNGVSVIGTGCNPGFTFDTLPLVLSSSLLAVESVKIRRTADVRDYDVLGPDMGLGLSLEAFDQQQADGRVIGFSGFEHSASALAGGIGWELDRIETEEVRPAFVAPAARHGRYMSIDPGHIVAVRQSCRAWAAGSLVIDYELHLGFFEDDDPVEVGDSFVITGDARTLVAHVPTGFESLPTVVALALNLAPAVVAAAPGLLTMTDIAVGDLRAASFHTEKGPLNA
jgi:hypothetical protein